MSKYILVHGSWHGSWCWKYLASCLEQKGQQVVSLDLPRAGYADYYACLKNAVTASNTPVIVVAHSMSGIIAAPLLEEIPHCIKHLYLIAAYVPQDGQSLIDIAERYPHSQLPQLLETDFSTGTNRLKKEGLGKILYHDCSKEIQDWAVPQLQDQPLAPLSEPIHCHYDPDKKPLRTYLLCENDRAVDPEAQRDMAKNCPSHVIRMKTGHFPFLSHPEQVAKLLL